MIKVVVDQHVGKAPKHGLNRSVHYWWRVRKAGRRFFDDQYLWNCPQCGTCVVKTSMSTDPWEGPLRHELVDAGVSLDCQDQLLRDVMES